MTNKPYDLARNWMSNAGLNWTTLDLAIVAWSGPPTFVATDTTIQTIITRGTTTKRGISMVNPTKTVAADGTVVRQVDAGANGPLALADRWLWAASQDISARHSALLRLDPRTGEEHGRIELGARHAVTLVTVGNDLWATLDDGTVRVIR